MKATHAAMFCAICAAVSIHAKPHTDSPPWAIAYFLFAAVFVAMSPVLRTSGRLPVAIFAAIGVAYFVAGVFLLARVGP